MKTNEEDLIRYISSGEARTVLQNLPTTVRGFVVHGMDDYKLIVLNARLTRELNQRTSLHEADHILSGELDDPDYMEYTG